MKTSLRGERVTEKLCNVKYCMYIFFKMKKTFILFIFSVNALMINLLHFISSFYKCCFCVFLVSCFEHASIIIIFSRLCLYNEGFRQQSADSVSHKYNNYGSYCFKKFYEPLFFGVASVLLILFFTCLCCLGQGT